jgi:hypothetical protein
MTEAVATWQTVGAWFGRSVVTSFPTWVVKRFWTTRQLLDKIEVFHFPDGSQFQVRSYALSPELSGGGFNVFNFTPFPFAIVALELRMSVGSRQLYEYALRLPSEIAAHPFARTGFSYKWPLAGPALDYVRQYLRDDLRIDVQGHMIVKTVFGELKKEVHSSSLADIDRDTQPQFKIAS